VAGDPHSPNIDGFLVAHCGWYINQKRPFLILLYAFSGAFRMLFDAFWRPRNGLENNHYAKKIIGNKLCETVSKPINYTLIVFIYFTFLAIISVFIFGYYNGILFYYLTMVIIYNLGDAINSFGHNTFFIKPKNKENKSINSLFLSLFTFGEGFHEVHHSKPSKFRMNKNRFTISSLFIYLLELTHLIKPSRI
jgi:stearoyl-CoA desaturase (delta-9 desaturase)